MHHQTTLRIVGSSGETMSVELLLQIVLSIANISSHYTHFSVVHVPYNNYTVFCHSRITTIMSSGWLTWIPIIYCSSFIQFQSSQLFCPRASMASHHIGSSSVSQLPISDIYIYIYIYIYMTWSPIYWFFIFHLSLAYNLWLNSIPLYRFFCLQSMSSG